MAREVAVAPAIAWVRDQGSPLERAMLAVLLGEPLGDAELAALTEPQNPDGGFRVAEIPTKLSVVGRTAEMLTYLAAVGAEEFGAAHAAADFLIDRQRTDGTWGEADELLAFSPPPHFRPNSHDVVAWETAAAVVALAGMGLPLDLRAPLDFLRRHRVHPLGGRAFRLEALLIFAAARRVEGSASEMAKTLQPEVQRLAGPGLAVFELFWGIFAMRAADIPPNDPLVAALGNALAEKQRPDASFGSGPAGSPLETVLALCALAQSWMCKLPRLEREAELEPDPADSARAL
jgi:hypothetical protein